MPALLIQKDEEVERGVRILLGKESLKEDDIVLQFSYNREEYFGFPAFLGQGRTQAEEIIGNKGNLAIRNKLAQAINNCIVPNLHVKFIFCNLDETSILLLSDGLSKNSYLGGFSCMQNSCNFDKNNKYVPKLDLKVRDSIICCPSIYLSIWNNEELSNDIIAAKKLFSQMKLKKTNNRSSMGDISPIIPTNSSSISTSIEIVSVTTTSNSTPLDENEDEENMLLRRLEQVRQNKLLQKQDLNELEKNQKIFETKQMELKIKLELNNKQENLLRNQL